MCSDTDEDSLHALFTCSRASQVWKAANLRNIADNAMNEFDNKMSIVLYLLDQLQPSHCSLFTPVFCGIWKRRNLRL